eukprot:6463645-Amphidinium_carterae.1
MFLLTRILTSLSCIACACANDELSHQCACSSITYLRDNSLILLRIELCQRLLPGTKTCARYCLDDAVLRRGVDVGVSDAPSSQTDDDA